MQRKVNKVNIEMENVVEEAYAVSEWKNAECWGAHIFKL